MLQVNGLVALQTRLNATPAKALAAVTAALREEAELIMTTAKERTPVDTGTLRASGHVTPVALTGTVLVATLGFGGAAKNYALRVHEDLGARHTVGQAKFLESAVAEARPGFRARLEQAAREIAATL